MTVLYGMSTQATSLLHSANCQKYSRPQQNRLEQNESPSTKDRPLHHKDSQHVLSQPTVHRALLFESVMSVVWSHQRVAQRTFGTTVSIAGLTSEK